MEFGKHLEWLVHEPLASLNAEKLGRLSRGEPLLDLSMINPDVPPPRYLLDRLVEASLKPYNHRYAVSRGIRKLREAFAEKYSSAFATSLDPEREICVTMGSKDGLLQALRCVAAPGESVLLGQPAYPAHLSAIALAGLHYDFFDLSRDPAQILERIAQRCSRRQYRVLLLNFPHNPTGICVTPEFYRELVTFCRERGIFVLNDFVYGEMQHDGTPAQSLLGGGLGFAGLGEIYSISKAYSVPGWRVGAFVGDSQVVSLLSRLKARVDYGIFLPIQMAAAAALVSPEPLAKEVTAEYQRRSELLVGGLKRLGWELTTPPAGASVWARIPARYELDELSPSRSINFALRLLQRNGVLVMPGALFGEAFDEFVRFALVVNEEGVRHVIEKLEEFPQSSGL